jgi:hypothetical protein
MKSVFDPTLHIRLMELEQEKSMDSIFPPGEDFGAKMHRSRLAHLRESQMIPESYRQWWLDEQGWLLEPGAPDRPAQPSPIARLLGVAGDILIAAGAWLRRRANPVAELQT